MKNVSTILHSLKLSYEIARQTNTNVFVREYKSLYYPMLDKGLYVTSEDVARVRNRFTSREKDNLQALVDKIGLIYKERLEAKMFNDLRDLIEGFNKMFIEFIEDYKYTHSVSDEQVLEQFPIVLHMRKPESDTTIAMVDDIIGRQEEINSMKEDLESNKYFLRKRCDVCRKVCKEHN